MKQNNKWVVLIFFCLLCLIDAMFLGSGLYFLFNGVFGSGLLGLGVGLICGGMVLSLFDTCKPLFDELTQSSDKPLEKSVFIKKPTAPTPKFTMDVSFKLRWYQKDMIYGAGALNVFDTNFQLVTSDETYEEALNRVKSVSRNETTVKIMIAGTDNVKKTFRSYQIKCGNILDAKVLEQAVSSHMTEKG